MKRYIVSYLLLHCCILTWGQELKFNSTDKICFVGNSITMNGGFYHNLALFYATRYPDKPLIILNKGINGNGAADVIKRMDYDILAENPTWCVLKLGMNDVLRELYLPETVKNAHNLEQRRQAFLTYKKNIRIIVDTLLAHHINVILQTPTIYDQTSTMTSINLRGRNDALKEFADYIQKLGQELHLKTVDYWHPMEKINNKVQVQDPTATIIGPDRVHPGVVGHMVMTYELLKSIELHSSVSKIIIKKTEEQSNLAGANNTISKFWRNSNSVKFICLEGALPFPVQTGAEKALTLVPFTHTFNEELLKVGNLTPGKYKLTIDSVLIGNYSNVELRSGLNLALIKQTPQYQQAFKVLTLFNKYWSVESEWREYSLRKFQKAFQNNSDEAPAILKKSTQEVQWRNELYTMKNEIYQVNKPTAHTFLIQKLL